MGIDRAGFGVHEDAVTFRRGFRAFHSAAVKVALAQINTTVGDVWGNVEKMKGALGRAVEAGAEVLGVSLVTNLADDETLLRESGLRRPALQEALRGVTRHPGLAVVTSLRALNGGAS